MIIIHIFVIVTIVMNDIMIMVIIIITTIAITFVALIGWGTMRPPVECAEAAEEVGKGR